jgi:hypothetical protein
MQYWCVVVIAVQHNSSGSSVRAGTDNASRDSSRVVVMLLSSFASDSCSSHLDSSVLETSTSTALSTSNDSSAINCSDSCTAHLNSFSLYVQIRATFSIFSLSSSVRSSPLLSSSSISCKVCMSVCTCARMHISDTP